MLSASQNQGALLVALAELPERERVMVSLRYGAELNANEIGTALAMGADRGILVAPGDFYGPAGRLPTYAELIAAAKLGLVTLTLNEHTADSAGETPGATGAH